MKKYLLFDLDGTLTDPKLGICTCAQYALASFGIDEPDLDKLEPFIGPPLKDSFMDFYQMTEEQAEAAIKKYRERFSDVGLFENTMYEGVDQMLKALSSRGMVLAVASSKPTVFVEKILEHFHIRQYFKVVVGSELDGRRSNKDEVVEEALRQLFRTKRVEKSEVYMIGDRKFDAIGARAMGIESIGVTYGYGSMEELKEAKADYIVQSVEELKKFLLRGTDDAPKGLDMNRVVKTAIPIAMFIFVKMGAMYLTQGMFLVLGGSIFGVPMVDIFEDGTAMVTGNGRAVMSLVGFIAGAAAILKGARVMIPRAKEESYLSHLRKESVSSYVYFALCALGAMFVLNILLQKLGLTAISGGYNTATEAQQSVNIILGILLYALAAPVAEELLFRGIVYNGLKRSIKPLYAALLSALIFGVYHGNSVQSLYGFLMGFLFAYGYEYFGNFAVPVVCHIVVNLLTYLLGAVGVFGFLMNWTVCIIALVVGALGLFSMIGQKRIY